MNWLLDTNVISESRKPRPIQTLLSWLTSLEVGQMHTSTVNMAELVYGAECQNDIAKRRELFQWIDGEVRRMLFGRIHGITEDTLVRWRHISRTVEVKKQPGPATDLLIAAVALQHGLGIATRDVAPFVAAGVATFNPFTGERFNGA